VLEALRGYLRGSERAWLVGSLAWGRFGPHSDVDVVMSGLTPERSLELESLVARAANVPADLLAFEDLPSAFRRRVEEEGIAVP
jgi:predicted nucleotidyltransferase